MEISVRPIEKYDIELLRQWKNTNKQAFFHKQDITPKEQERWFEGYRRRNQYHEDFMYMVLCDGHSAGCLGYRLADDTIDIYNVIIDKRYQSKGIMREAFEIIHNLIRNEFKNDITVKVLPDNPAVGFYNKIGFNIEYYFMRLE